MSDHLVFLLSYRVGLSWSPVNGVHGINGVNEFPASATLGGLLTWPLGAVRVVSCSWVRAGWRRVGPRGYFEFERDGPLREQEDTAPWAGSLNQVEGQ